jgi:hypothetical protein
MNYPNGVTQSRRKALRNRGGVAMSHTPGPWTVTGERSFQNPDEDRVWVDAAAEFNHTADDEGRWSVAELRGPDSIANSRLIAAAPEMLEALKWCVKHLELIAERDYPGSDEKGRRFNSTSAGLAAIAKATGGAE